MDRLIHFKKGDRLPDDRVVLSGARRAGKSFVAKESGYDIYGVADPMYELSEQFLGTADKSNEGVREFLQGVGAAGRGDEPQAECPLPSARWPSIADDVRKFGQEITSFKSDLWAQFGRRSDFWVQVLCSRIERAEGRVAVPNGRFPDEINTLTRDCGFSHYHVMCHPKTRRERLVAGGEDPDSGAENDITEQLAAELDQIVQDVNLAQQTADDSLWEGLRPTLVLKCAERRSVIWSDPTRNPSFT